MDTFQTESQDPSKAAVEPSGQETVASATTGEATPSGGENWENKYRDLYDQYVRLAADFENSRRRYQQDQDALRKYAAENTIRELIPVLDNLERASGSLSENSEPKILFQSFRLVYNQLIDALGTLGVKRMQTVGKPFDPVYHEAVSQVENDTYPDHTVVTEMQSGFMIQDRVLRPAMVAVSVKSSGGGEAAPAEKPKENPFSQVGDKGQ